MAALGLLGVLQSSVVMQLSEDVKYAWQRSSLHFSFLGNKFEFASGG